MNLPDKPIRILGIPWTVEVLERVNGSVEAATDTSVEKAIIQLSETTYEGRIPWHLFWCILRALTEHVGYGDATDKGDELDRCHASLFTAIRDNWGEVRKWFGPTPAVEPCILRINGMDWQLKRTKWVPGYDDDTLGLSQGRELTIYVRGRDISPYRAAEVAIHELMHASIQSFCRLGDVEQWVKGMSGPLAQIFFDNPEWVDFLFSDQPLEGDDKCDTTTTPSPA